jgi:hypothetical protein
LKFGTLFVPSGGKVRLFINVAVSEVLNTQALIAQDLPRPPVLMARAQGPSELDVFRLRI